MVGDLAGSPNVTLCTMCSGNAGAVRLKKKGDDADERKPALGGSDGGRGWSRARVSAGFGRCADVRGPSAFSGTVYRERVGAVQGPEGTALTYSDLRKDAATGHGGATAVSGPCAIVLVPERARRYCVP